jgi:hypothetical protein
VAQTVPADLAAGLDRLLGGVPDRSWSTASGALLAVRGDVVVKVHPAGTDAADLGARVRTAARPALAGVLAAPLRSDVVSVTTQDGVRWATVWPRLDVLAPDSAAAPWQEAAQTLAALHRAHLHADVPADGLPPHGAPDRLRRAVARVAPHDDDARARAVVAAGRGVLADVVPSAATGLVHGDWHLGQLGRDTAGRWLLLDLDDLGTGDPGWDLGRPAGFHAAGLLDEAVWTAFLAAYRAAGGPGVPAGGDPWPALDVPARAEVVVAAARAVDRVLTGAEPWDDEAEALLAACTRM